MGEDRPATTASSRATTLRLLRRLHPHRARVALAIGLALLMGALSFATFGALYPILVVTFDSGDGVLDATGARDHWWVRWIESQAAGDPMHALWLAVAALVAVAAVAALVKFLHEVAVVQVCQRAQLDVAEDLYDRLTRQDETTLARVGLSNVNARFSYDLDMTGKALETFTGTLILEPIRFVAALGYATWISWQLTLVAAVFVPATLAVGKTLGRRIRRSAEGMLDKRARMLTRVQETVGALPVVQVYGQQERERGAFRQVTGRVYAWAKRLARLDAASHAVLELVSVLAVAPVVLVGGALVLDQTLSTADYMQFYLVFGFVYGPLRKVVGAANRIQGGVAGAARIFETMDLEATVTERPDARELPPLARAVSWEDVRVTYPDGRVALRGVSCHAPHGRTTALVGPSGAGKTTLLHTLPRLLDPDAGTVRLDGVDVREATLESLRGRMALVEQAARLFGGTVAENVAYAVPGASEEAVREAGRISRVDELVERLPDGWDTRLDESGAGLSGGERQRVAIARAVLRDPELLLLDEPTSALDPENERLVRLALEEASRGRTAVVVAHRPATVWQADHVVVLREGRVEAEGSPADVALVSPTYRELFGSVAPT